MEETQLMDETQPFFDPDESDNEETSLVGWLVVGNDKNPLHEGVIKLGRDPATCSIILEDKKTISKEHVVIHATKTSVTITDLGSRNKTKLNKIYLEPHVRYALQGGEILRFGDVKCTYLCNSSVVSESDTSGSSLRNRNDNNLAKMSDGPDESADTSFFSPTPQVSSSVFDGPSCTKDIHRDSKIVPETPVMPKNPRIRETLHNIIEESPTSQSTPLNAQKKYAIELPVISPVIKKSAFDRTGIQFGLREQDKPPNGIQKATEEYNSDDSTDIEDYFEKDSSIQANKSDNSQSLALNFSEEKGVVKAGTRQSDDEDDVFNMPTHIFTSEKKDESETDGEDIYNMPTQLFSSVKNNVDDDIFNMPTQHFASVSKKETDDDIFDMPTQQVTPSNLVDGATYCRDSDIDSTQDVVQAFNDANDDTQEITEAFEKHSKVRSNDEQMSKASNNTTSTQPDIHDCLTQVFESGSDGKEAHTTELCDSTFLDEPTQIFEDPAESKHSLHNDIHDGKPDTNANYFGDRLGTSDVAVTEKEQLTLPNSLSCTERVQITGKCRSESLHDLSDSDADSDISETILGDVAPMEEGDDSISKEENIEMKLDAEVKNGNETDASFKVQGRASIDAAYNSDESTDIEDLEFSPKDTSNKMDKSKSENCNPRKEMKFDVSTSKSEDSQRKDIDYQSDATFSDLESLPSPSTQNLLTEFPSPSKNFPCPDEVAHCEPADTQKIANLDYIEESPHLFDLDDEEKFETEHSTKIHYSPLKKLPVVKKLLTMPPLAKEDCKGKQNKMTAISINVVKVKPSDDVFHKSENEHLESHDDILAQTDETKMGSEPKSKQRARMKESPKIKSEIPTKKATRISLRNKQKSEADKEDQTKVEVESTTADKSEEIEKVNVKDDGEKYISTNKPIMDLSIAKIGSKKLAKAVTSKSPTIGSQRRVMRSVVELSPLNLQAIQEESSIAFKDCEVEIRTPPKQGSPLGDLFSSPDLIKHNFSGFKDSLVKKTKKELFLINTEKDQMINAPSTDANQEKSNVVNNSARKSCRISSNLSCSQNQKVKISPPWRSVKRNSVEKQLDVEESHIGSISNKEDVTTTTTRKSQRLKNPPKKFDKSGDRKITSLTKATPAETVAKRNKADVQDKEKSPAKKQKVSIKKRTSRLQTPPVTIPSSDLKIEPSDSQLNESIATSRPKRGIKHKYIVVRESPRKKLKSSGANPSKTEKVVAPILDSSATQPSTNEQISSVRGGRSRLTKPRAVAVKFSRQSVRCSLPVKEDKPKEKLSMQHNSLSELKRSDSSSSLENSGSSISEAFTLKMKDTKSSPMRSTRSSRRGVSPLHFDDVVLYSPAQRQGMASLKPRVLFTSYTDKNDQKLVKTIGGQLVESATECTVLIAVGIRRTCKFLAALARGVPIVSPEWLMACKRANSFVDPWQFLVSDKEAEKKFKFSLKSSLGKAVKKRLLKGYSIHATPSVKPPPDQIREIIECAGGEFLEMPPKMAAASPCVVVISCEEDKKTWQTFTKLKLPIVSAEFILTGILKQDLLIKQNLLVK